MEARFIANGKTVADKFRELNPDHVFPEDLDDRFADWEYRDFIAEMSDDYSVTKREQREIKAEIHAYLGEDIEYNLHWK